MLFNRAKRGVSDSPAIDVAAHGKPYWAPKFWHGMTFRVWLRLLARNRFAVDLALWPAALMVTAATMVNSALAMLQLLRFGRKIARTEIREPPIFILGHWRSGTTLLHRLFSQDDRFAFPTTFDCFSPKSSLVTARFARRWLGLLHPMRRLQDNMADGFDYPHEDEFALCSMGLASPYVQFAFPNRPQGEEFVDFAGVAPAEVHRWKAGLRWFMQLLTLRSGKRVVLKSPPHTARIRLLLELFPDARFVHIVRHPFAVFPSMLWTRKLNYRAHGLQRPRYDGLEEFVCRNFLRMHRAYMDQKGLITAGGLFGVR
jgi:omega-hydroxy-beta-dihydromenaquinone-9 sulfotransferase